MDYKDFYNRDELIKWLKTYGVRLDDAENPLKFNNEEHHHYGNVYHVIQWSLLGWMKEL